MNETKLPLYRHSVDKDGEPRIVAMDEHTRLAVIRLCEFVQKHNSGAAWADARDVLASVNAAEQSKGTPWICQQCGLKNYPDDPECRDAMCGGMRGDLQARKNRKTCKSCNDAAKERVKRSRE